MGRGVPSSKGQMESYQMRKTIRKKVFEEEEEEETQLSIKKREWGERELTVILSSPKR
jgi:hypothetical protein